MRVNEVVTTFPVCARLLFFYVLSNHEPKSSLTALGVWI